MLSSGVDSQERTLPHPLDSSMSAVVQELYTGLPVSISTELTAGSEPNVRLDTKPEASTLVQAHSSSLLSESHGISGVDNCSQETDDLDHGDKLASDGLAGFLSEESMGTGNLPENEETKSGSLGKQNACANGSQKEKRGSVKEIQDGEEEHVGCCVLASEEKCWLRQEAPQINQSGGEFSRICCTEMAGLLKSKEENQTNVQVTPEILPKPTEEVQGMKADGTRIFSKAGRRNDRVSKGLPPENNECSDIDTITANGEVSETNTLVPLELLRVVETGSTKEYTQEEKEYKDLTACTTMSLTTMGCAIFDSGTGEVKLSRSTHVNETNAAPATYQAYQQDEENSPHNNYTVPKSNVEVDMPLSKESSEALCGSLRSLCSLESGNMSLEDNTTEICEIQEEYLAEEIESPSCDGDSQRTEFLETWISKPVIEEQPSPVQSEEMSSDEADQSETDGYTDHSYSCGSGKFAEIQKETVMKNSCGIDSGHAIQESVHSESSNSPVPSSVASSTEEFPKGDLSIPSEINSLKKDEDQWQIHITTSPQHTSLKQHTKENGTLLVDTKNLISIQTGDVHTCFNNICNKYANCPPTVHDFLDYSTKVGEISLEVQQFEKDTNSSSVVEDLNNSFGKAPEANNVNLPTCKETNFAYTLGEALRHDAENSRVSLGVLSELSSCYASAVSNRDVYLHRLSKKESIIASAKLEAQHAGLDEGLSLINHRNFNTSNVASKGTQKNIHSSLGDTEKIVTDMEKEESDTCTHKDQCIKDHCSAVKTCFILLDSSTGLNNATLNKDSVKVQAKLKTEEVNGLETEDLLVHNDKKAVSCPEENTHVTCESFPCEDSWNCSNMFQYMTNCTSTAEKLLYSACTPNESITRFSEVEISNTNIKAESLKLYDGHSEITEERLDPGTRERASDTDKGQEQINSHALQKDEIDRIETVDSVKTHKGSHQNETGEQSVNRDLNKTMFDIHLELGNITVVLGDGELKKTVLPCEDNLSEGSTSTGDTDSGFPSHEKHLDQSFDLELSGFKHSKESNETICQVENQYLACQSEHNGPVSCKKNETQVADEVLEFQQYDLDMSNKQISNTGVQTKPSSVEEPKRSIHSKENKLLALKKDEDTSSLVHESLREKNLQGTFKEIMVDNSSSSMVDADCSEYTDSISDLLEGEKVELKESDNVGSSTREDPGTLKGSMVGCSSSTSLINMDHSEYIDSLSSAKEDQKEEQTIFSENTKLSALLNMGSLVMDLENKIKTVVESFSVSQSACKSLHCSPEDRTLVPEIRDETCLLLDSLVNHRIIERNRAYPQPELVTFTIADDPETVNPVQSKEFCAKQELSSLKGVTSEILVAQNSEICLPQKDELPVSSENAQIVDQDSFSANALCKDYSAIEPLELIDSLERRARGNDSPSEEREKEISSLNDAVELEVCMASHAHRKERSVRTGESEPTVKEMDVISSDSIDCVQKFKRPSVEDQRQDAVTTEKIETPMHSIFDHKNYLGVLLEDLKFSGDKVIDCVPLKAETCEKPSETYSTELPERSLNNLSEKGKTYVKDHSELGNVKLLSEIIDCYLQSKDLVNKETPEIHYNMLCSNKLSKNDTEASLKCLSCSEVCLPYELSSQSKDNRKEVIGDQMKMPHDSVNAENEVPEAESLGKVGECQTLKRKMCEETEVHPAQNILLCKGWAQQIKESKDQEKAEIPLQDRVVFDSEPLDSSSDELMTSSRVMKTEGPREQLFAVMSSINDSDNKQIYSTLQEVKRPKISKDGGDNSEHMKTIDSEVENLSFHLGTHIELSADNTPFIPLSLSLPQAKSFAGDHIHGAFGNAHKLRGFFSLKKQPRRKCKKIPTPDKLKTIRKSYKGKSSALIINSPESVPRQEHKLLSSVYFACKPSEIAMRLNHMSKQRANRRSLLNSVKLSKCTKEPTLLSRLSTMASKLMAPPKSIHRLKTLQCSSERPVVERFSQLGSKKLLEVFSCINMKLNSHQADDLCTKMFNLQPLALYPLNSTKIHSLDLSSNIPSSVFNTPISPISFHIKLDSDSLINLRGITSQQDVPDIPTLGETLVHPSQPSKWTFSFLLSQGCSGTAAFREDTNLSKKLHSSALSLTTTKAVIPSHDIRRNPIAKRRTLCSMLGLHTVLALSSPGCYRIWTRRRNVTSRIPTVQRLFMAQFTEGLKGLRSPTSVSADLFSSLPYSLGRVLSIWSQHGPPACPSELTPLHSNHCKWQPSLGIANSYAVLPHMTVQGTEAARTTGAEIRLECSLSDLLPKSCTFPESEKSPLRLSVPELQVHPFDELNASLPPCPTSQSATELKEAEPEKMPKRVSQIRIRKTVPKPDPNLTPMGLPRPKRLKKKEFSLEEIYTNKNYKSPPATRCLETIFEEPKEKNGSLISISQQKRKRILEFQDFTIPRKRKARSRVKVAGSFTRAKKAALQGRELDALLIKKLMDLEAFFAEEEKQEQASGS